MERDSSIGIGARGSIFEIALDRTAHIRQLTSDLVMTAGQKFHFNKPVSVSLADLLII
jgi:hypothetical protein